MSCSAYEYQENVNQLSVIDLIRAGVIGLGKMGKLHFLNSMHMKNVEVIGVADKKKTNLKMVTPYHVNVYEDYQDLLNKESLDAVIISLPNFLKDECVSLAAEKQLDIFIDKPLARNLIEAENIIRKIRSTHTNLMVGVNYRYIESVQKVKQLVESGRFGEIVIGTADLIMDGPFSHPLIPKPVSDWWFSKDKAGGGALLDLGYHLIDIFQWMFNDLTVESSLLQYRYHLPLEDAATVILKSSDPSTTMIVNVGWFSKTIFPQFNFRINFHGTVGHTSTDYFAPKSLYIHAIKEGVANFGRRMIGRPIKRLSYTYYYHSFTKILELFFHSILQDKPFPTTAEDQLGILKIIDEIYQKDRANRDG